jgi:hypothetical protein
MADVDGGVEAGVKLSIGLPAQPESQALAAAVRTMLRCFMMASPGDYCLGTVLVAKFNCGAQSKNLHGI